MGAGGGPRAHITSDRPGRDPARGCVGRDGHPHDTRADRGDPAEATSGHVGREGPAPTRVGPRRHGVVPRDATARPCRPRAGRHRPRGHARDDRLTPPRRPRAGPGPRWPPSRTCRRMERDLLDRWRELDVFATSVAPARGRARLDLLRGPADRQRQARHPPRRGAGLQGRLPALPDDEGRTRSAARAAGTATACPSSSRWRRSSGSTRRPTSRPTASRRSTPAAASRSAATSARSRS